MTTTHNINKPIPKQIFCDPFPAEFVLGYPSHWDAFAEEDPYNQQQSGLPEWCEPAQGNGNAWGHGRPTTPTPPDWEPRPPRHSVADSGSTLAILLIAISWIMAIEALVRFDRAYKETETPIK